jgi:hypothetical protein
LARGPFLSDAVLAPFSSFGYRPTMLADDKLTPADPREVVIALSLGLTAKPKFAQHQAAETMAKIVAERLAEHLERSGFVIMRKPVPASGAGDNPGARSPGRSRPSPNESRRPGEDCNGGIGRGARDNESRATQRPRIS